MLSLIITAVCVYSISVIAAFEVGRYDRRNQSTEIEGQWWMNNNQNIESEDFKDAKFSDAND